MLTLVLTSSFVSRTESYSCLLRPWNDEVSSLSHPACAHDGELACQPAFSVETRESRRVLPSLPRLPFLSITLPRELFAVELLHDKPCVFDDAYSSKRRERIRDVLELPALAFTLSFISSLLP